MTETDGHNIDPTLPSIAQAVGRVEGLLTGIGYEMRDVKKQVNVNTNDIQLLKNSNLVEATEKKVEESFYKKHPIKTAIGGISIGGVSLFTLISGIVMLIIELKDKGVIP